MAGTVPLNLKKSKKTREEIRRENSFVAIITTENSRFTRLDGPIRSDVKKYDGCEDLARAIPAVQDTRRVAANFKKT